MEKLKERIDKMYPTRADFAKEMGINPSGLSRMLASGNWRADRIEKAVKLLQIAPEEIPAYFFVDSVALKATKETR